ncbi:MAG: hypothetical protein SFU91_11265 [Chloroherpetonaceae bacterium]|nr:hypothetical protein [Chloroherpetonaceae bacterium]
MIRALLGILSFLIVYFNFAAPSFAQPESYSHPELKWKTITTKHFTVSFHEGSERSAQLTAKIAEEIYGPITSLYGFAPQRVDIIIKDTDDYSNGGAYFFENKIELWAPALEFHLRGQHDWLRNVITHEFTHIVTLNVAFKYGRLIPAFYFQVFGYETVRRPDVLYGFPNILVSYPIAGLNVPFWLAEGVAQYQRSELSYETWDSHRDMILRTATLEGNFWNLDEISNFIVKSGFGGEYGYNFGFAFTRFLAERYGESKLKVLLKNFSSVATLNVHRALEETYGKSSDLIYREWKEYTERNYRASVSEILKKEVKGKQLELDGTFLSPVYSHNRDTLFYISNNGADFGGYGLYALPIDTLSKVRSETSLSPTTLHQLVNIWGSTEGHEKQTHAASCRFCGYHYSESQLAIGVDSRITLSPDGRKLYYSKYVGTDFEIQRFNDLFEFDLATKEEKRLSKQIRVETPFPSKDGKRLLGIHQSDGTMNLVEVELPTSDTLVTPRGVKFLTSMKSGEQLYQPIYAPNGSDVIVALGKRNRRQLVMWNRETGTMMPLVKPFTPTDPTDENLDERDPNLTTDGLNLIFSSNRGGIFNLYEYEFSTGNTRQLTNVTSGAFMPSYGETGKVAYSHFTSKGYKLAFLEQKKTDAGSPSLFDSRYIVNPIRIIPDSGASPLGLSDVIVRDLNQYNDSIPPSFESKEYSKIFTPPMILPLVRFDAYAKTKGTLAADAWRAAKFGIAFNSAEALGNLNLSGLITIAPGSSVSGGSEGIAGLLELERDAFFSLEYSDKNFLPASMLPKFNLDIFHLTRNIQDGAKIGGYLSDSSPLDSANANVFFGLTQYELSTRFRIPIQNALFQASNFRLSFALSPYNSKIGSFFWEPLGQRITASSETYFIGRTASFIWNLDWRIRSLTSTINPIGFLSRIRVDYEDSKLQRDITFNESTGTFTPVYQNYQFFRVTADWNFHFPLPTWSNEFNHSLTIRLFSAANFTAPTDFFFQNFISGLLGMRGYEFYAIGGDKAAFLHAEYRIPLAQHLDMQFFQFYFDRLYLSTFFDIGNAWNGNTIPSPNTWKKDIGFELRLEAPSFYLFPTRIFISGTYGIDRFTEPVRQGFFTQDGSTVIIYGGEWRFHLGILFDFDFLAERTGIFRNP